jgi:hypothetical protein
MDQQQRPAAFAGLGGSLIYGPSIPLIQEEIYDDQSESYLSGYSRNIKSAVFHQPDMTLHIGKSYFW